MLMMDFSDWINAKYYEWRGLSKRTITDFAKYLNIPQPLMSEWMKPHSMGGKKPRSQKYISLLFQKYGNEVYAVLGLPLPREPLSILPSYLRRRLLDAQVEIERIYQVRGITGEMPEADKIAIEVMERYGFKYIGTEELPDK